MLGPSAVQRFILENLSQVYDIEYIINNSCGSKHV